MKWNNLYETWVKGSRGPGTQQVYLDSLTTIIVDLYTNDLVNLSPSFVTILCSNDPPKSSYKHAY